jgi:2'-5' RNA ligase
MSRLATEAQGHGGREHHQEDLHMTLVFLGAVGPDQLSCIEQVADAISAKPFSLQLDRIDYWPRPRILLLGSSETPENLADLVAGLQTGLTACGFKPEKRPYRPHITLARKAKKVAAAALERPLQWRPREFVLAGSNLQGKPPRYQVLKRWKIG